MRPLLSLTLAAAALSLTAGISLSATMPETEAYPATRVVDAADLMHGVSVSDPYRWLEDVKSPEVKSWMDAQDHYARERLAKLPGHEALAQRLRELFYVDSISAPAHRGKRYFYSRRHADREKAVIYWKEGEHGEEHVLLDPNTMSKDGSTSVGTWAPSWDGKRVAYALHVNNADEATLYVKEVATGQISEVDVIQGAKYAAPQWTPSGDGFYYAYLPTDAKIPVSERPGYTEIRYHQLGTPQSADPLLHERTGDPKTFLNVSLSRDGRWLFAYIRHGWNATDVYYRDLHHAEPAWKPFVVGQPAQFSVIPWKEHFYVITNQGAPRWHVYRTETGHPDREHWREIVPEDKSAVLDNAQVIGGHLVLTYLKNAASALEIRTLEGKPVRAVPLPGIGATTGMVGNPDEDDAYFAFTSFTTPPRIYHTSVKSGETALWSEVKVPVDPSPYTVEQVWYPSKDGTKVSMFIVRRKDLPRDGSTPFLLYGYGGFNLSMTPAFASSIYPWLEAGGGYAVANLRGGGEYGEEWHQAGMLARKQNVFDDYISAAEYLVHEGYTKPERLAIRGGSNGGLLVGAAVTQRPDLFRAAICAVPLLDMVRYHLFGSGRTWIPEYGTAEDAAQFKAIYAYSPYHHVKPGTHYPALLMLSADSDDRVDPMHARKMVARLQAANAGPHPIWMRIEKNAGHGGADMVRQAVEQNADQYAFLMRELGMTPAAHK